MATFFEILSQSALLILLLLLLRPVFKKRLGARLRYALWLLPALRLLVPFSVQSVMSIWNIMQPGLPARLIMPNNSTMMQALAGITVLPASPAVIDAAGQAAQAASPVLNAVHPAEAVPVDWVRILSFACMAVWVLGSFAALLMLAVNNIRLVQRLQKAEWVMTQGKLPVLLADALPSPCLAGFFRPRIVITPEVLASGMLLDMVLLHEQTHYRHRDHLWTALRGILLCLWWWNPLVWLAAHVSRRDCEAACDEAVICRMPPESRRQYGMSLIALLNRKPSAQSLLQTTTAMQGSKRAMKERITMIANWKSKGRIAAVCIALCAVLLVPVLCTSAVGQTAQPPETETSAAGTPQDQTAKERPDTFSLEKAGAYRDNEFLFAGSNGPPYGTALLLCTDGDGQIKWAVQGDHAPGDVSKFKAVIPYGDDEYIAIRTVSSPNNRYRSVLALIRDGSILGQIQRPYIIDGLFPAERGFLEISTPSVWTTIKKVDFEQGLIWQKTYEENWIFDEVVTVGDGYIAIGRCTRDFNDVDSTVGLVVKLDRNGDIVWKHYNTRKSVFTGGVSVSDNSVVLAGDAHVAVNTPAREAKIHSFIAQYDENGLVWQTDYHYNDRNTGRMLSIIQAEGGFLAACNVSGASGLRLLLTDKQGNIIKEWDEPIGNLSNLFPYALHNAPGGIYLTADGQDPEGKWLTVLKRISMPSAGSPGDGGTVTQLTIRDTDPWTVAQRPQTVPYRGTPDEGIERLTAKWNDQYKDSDAWDLERTVREDINDVFILPGEGMITHLDAIHILLEYIRQTYSDMSLDTLSSFKPYIALRIDLGSPLWQITFIPPDMEEYDFTGYIFAETGEIMSVAYGPGNG